MTYTDRILLQRHGIYEKRFALAFGKVLRSNYFELARLFESDQSLNLVNPESMQRVYSKLYLDIMQKEGAFIWNELVAPITGEEVKTKDIFDAVASIFKPDQISKMQPFWKKLMTGFLDTYIGQRVTEVMGTTVKRVNALASRLRGEGKDNKDIAKEIRNEGRKQQLRANTIARTEATTAMNKAWILSLQSSGMNWEKSWNAIRDDRTRQDHFFTNPALFIPLLDNFIIGVYPMAYPGDSTQGSPIGEIINCRCFLRFKISGTQYGFRPIERTL